MRFICHYVASQVDPDDLREVSLFQTEAGAYGVLVVDSGEESAELFADRPEALDRFERLVDPRPESDKIDLLVLIRDCAALLRDSYGHYVSPGSTQSHLQIRLAAAERQLRDETGYTYVGEGPAPQ